MSSKEYMGTAYPLKNIDKNDIIPIDQIVKYTKNEPFSKSSSPFRVIKPRSKKNSPFPESSYSTPEPKEPKELKMPKLSKVKQNSPGRKISFKSIEPIPFRKTRSDSSLESSVSKSIGSIPQFTPLDSVTSSINTPDTDIGLSLDDYDFSDDEESVWRIVPTPPKRKGGYKTKKRKYIKKPKTLKKRIKKILKKKQIK